MPHITIESGQLTTEQKEALIKQITEVSANIMAIPQEFFMISIRELADTNIGIGGQSIDKIKEKYMKNTL